MTPQPSTPDRTRRLSNHAITRLFVLAVGLLAWAGVAFVEVHRLPKDWVLVYVVPPAEAALWLIAAMATVYLARVRFLPASLTRVVVAAAMALCVVHFNNWAFWEPTSYYQTHRGSFAQVAQQVRSGELGKSDSYYGTKLPLRVIDLSVDGNASIVGEQDGKPVVFLPVWLGIPDDAGGYLYFDGEPRGDLELDLYGRLVTFAELHKLGNGWWYA